MTTRDAGLSFLFGPPARGVCAFIENPPLRGLIFGRVWPMMRAIHEGLCEENLI